MKTNWRTVFLVARQEFMTYLRRRSFLVVTLSFPLIALLTSLFSTYSSGSPIESPASINRAEAIFDMLDGKIGIVDESGVIKVIPNRVENMFLQYKNIEEAEKALKDGKIKTFFYLPTSYLVNGEIEHVTRGADSSQQDKSAIELLLRENWLAELNSPLRQRVEEPVAAELVEVKFIFPISKDETSQNSSRTSFGLAYLAAMLLYSTIFMSAAFLLRSITTEKENHIMEVLLTSLQPIDLLTGKMIGLGILGLGQTIIWTGTAYLVTWSRFSAFTSGQLQISSFLGGMLLLYFVLGYALFATMMASLGALMPSTKASGPATMFVILPAIIPLMLLGPLTEQPHSLLAIILSLIPFTAPLTMIIRLTQVEVPLWQLISSILLMLLTIPLLLRLVSHLFQAQTLLASTDFSFRHLLTILRQKKERTS